jgi:hypothetical protein
MDENAKLAEPQEPRQIMYRAIILSALYVGAPGRGDRPRARADRAVLQDVRACRT